MRQLLRCLVVTACTLALAPGAIEAWAETEWSTMTSGVTESPGVLQPERDVVPAPLAAAGAIFPRAVLIDSVPNWSSGTPMGMAFDGTYYWQVGGGSGTQRVAQLAADFSLVAVQNVQIDCRSIFLNPVDNEIYIKSYSGPNVGGELLRLHREPFDGGFDTVFVNIFQGRQQKVIISPDGLTLFDQLNGAGRRYNAATGVVLGAFNLALPHDVTNPRGNILAHTGDYLLTMADTVVYAYDVATGSLIASAKLPAFGYSRSSEWSLSYTNGYLVISNATSAHYYLFALDGFYARYVGSELDTVPVASQTLKVAYSGGTGATTGRIFYRGGGAATYSTASLSAGTGDTLQYVLPTSVQTARGLDFRFEITRNAMTRGTGSSRTLLFAMNNAQGQRPTALPDGAYQIVSVPIDITGSNAVTTVFEDDLGTFDPKQWRLFSYDRATDAVVEFPSAGAVTNRRAYWLAARGARRYGTAGYSRGPNRSYGGIDYYAVALDSGWNLQANPVPFRIDWDDVEVRYNGVNIAAHPDSLIRDSIYWWSGGGYQTAQAIPAWGGVFIEARRGGVELLFRYREGMASPVARRTLEETTPAADGWTLQMCMSAGDYVDDGNYFGVRADAVAGADKYDFAKPPAAPEGLSMGFRLPEGSDTRLHRTDYRAPFENGAVWIVDLAPAVGRRLRIDDGSGWPQGMTVSLLLDVGAVMDLSPGVEVSLPDDARSARLVVGTAEFAAGEKSMVVPNDYSLDQNFPNPFNPRTSIRFALPEASDVRLSIFNVLGQRVRVLAEGRYEAGTHDLVWDGTDATGGSVASGVYFYRMESAGFTEQRKMLFLK